MEITDVFQMQCREAVSLARQGEIARALELARGAYRRAREKSIEPELLRALDTMALVQAVRGAYLEALALGIDAYRLGVRLNERSVAVHSLATVVGASAFILDTSDFLLDTLDFCLAEARPIGDTNLEIHIRNIRGVLLLKRGAFDASLAEFQAVCALLPEGDGTFPEPVVLANMAAVRMRKAEAAQRGERPALQLEAEQAINAVLTVAGKAGNREALSRAHYSRAGLLVQREDFALALNAFNESLMLAEGLKHRYRLIGIQIECGHIHLAMENYSLALAAFEGAHLEADTCRPCQELQIASDGMAAAHDKLGNRRAMLFANGLARREADEYRLACDTARRELGEFWREIGAS